MTKFNKVRYSELLDKVEISIENFSALSNSVDMTFRFDAEHYQKKYKAINKILLSKTHTTLGQLLKKPVTTGSTPSMQVEEFYGGDIPFIKTDNLRENRIIENFSDYLTVEGSKKLSGSALSNQDILVTIIGATFEVVGRCAVVRTPMLPANINQNIALLRVNSDLIDIEYLNIYLNTKYGRSSLYFHSRQTEQVNLNCREVERVIVPTFERLSTAIRLVVERAVLLESESKNAYLQAERMLLNAIDLADFKFDTNTLNIKKLSESFKLSGRLDSEYYQPKYESLESWVTREDVTCTIISNEFDLIKTKKVLSEGSYDYIEIGDVDTSTGSALSNKVQTVDLPVNAKIASKIGDILISTVRPNRGAIAVLNCDDEKLVVSSAFTVLRKKVDSNFLPETLKVLLRSPAYRTWLLKFNVGTQYPVINDEDILSLPIPLVSEEIHKAISEFEKKSASSRSISNKLFSLAIQSVELAIEDSEDDALKFLSEATLELMNDSEPN
jgi:type I restriction enzyme S subunit